MREVFYRIFKRRNLLPLSNSEKYAVFCVYLIFIYLFIDLLFFLPLLLLIIIITTSNATLIFVITIIKSVINNYLIALLVIS